MKAQWSVIFGICFISTAVFGQNAVSPAGQKVQFEQKVIELTNSVRAKHNLPPLRKQANLQSAAQWLAVDMARTRDFSHTDSQNRSIDPRLPALGYTKFQAIGENIAGGQKTPEQVMDVWMKSPGHRANLLSPRFREIGVGYYAASSSPLKRYWVQDFGSRFDTFPVVINGEAEQTKRSQVSLYVYGAEWAQQMRLSNDGKTWTRWQPYRSETSWELEAGSGERTVLVEIRRGNVIREAQDTIIVRSIKPEAVNAAENRPDRAAVQSK